MMHHQLTLDQLIAKSERFESQIEEATCAPMLTLLEGRVDAFAESLAGSRNQTFLTSHLYSALNVRRIELALRYTQNEEA